MIVTLLSGMLLGALITFALESVLDARKVERLIERTLNRADERWRQTLATNAATQAAVLTEAMRTAAFGGEPVKEGQVERVESLDEKLHREVSEQTIANGIEHLRAAYRREGIELSDAELREEVILLATQVTGTLGQ